MEGHIERLQKSLGGWKLRTHSEQVMQDDIEQVLKSLCIEHSREYTLSKTSRIDFFTQGVGVECKTHGSVSGVTRQLLRYAEFEEIESLVLITTKSAHRSLDGMQLQGKKVRVFWINSL